MLLRDFKDSLGYAL